MNLRAWRRAKEITQAEMAERLGIHVATYQNWEKAPQNISVRNALKISEILDDVLSMEKGRLYTSL